jgi:hypothetical protein
MTVSSQKWMYRRYDGMMTNPCINSFALSLSAFVAVLATKMQRREVHPIIIVS